jgi:hypothetical protein
VHEEIRCSIGFLGRPRRQDDEETQEKEEIFQLENGEVRQSLDMLPQYATANLTDGSRTKAKSCREVFYHYAASSQMSHFQNIRFGDLGQWAVRSGKPRILSSQDTEGMLLIFRRSTVFQIFEPIVRTLAILVISLMNWGGQRADEGCKNQQRNSKFFPFFITEQRYSGITRLGDFQSTQTAHRNASPVAPASDAFDPSEIAYFVQSFISNHRFPCLAHAGILAHGEDGFVL